MCTQPIFFVIRHSDFVISAATPNSSNVEDYSLRCGPTYLDLRGHLLQTRSKRFDLSLLARNGRFQFVEAKSSAEVLGSTGCQPVVVGSLPTTSTGLQGSSACEPPETYVPSLGRAFRQAAEKDRFATSNPSCGGLAACAHPELPAHWL